MKQLPVVIACLMLVGAASAEDWPTFRRNAARTGISSEPWTKTALQVAWASQVDPESVDASPAVVGNRLYAGTASGLAICLSVADGSVIWKAQTGGAIMSSPAVADGRAFMGSVDRCLYAFDASDGKRLWRVRTRGAVVAPPLVLGDRVYCGSMDGTFRCLNAADGAELWRVSGGPVSGAAASAGDLVYYGDERGSIFGRSCSDGQAAWEMTVPGGIVASPVVVADRLLVPVMSPTALSPPNIKCLLALDARTGVEAWSLTKASSVVHTPISDGTNVYFATVSGYLSDTELLALRLSDGLEVWKRRLGGVADSSPALAGDMLLFGNHDSNFYMVSREDGAVVQSLPLGGKMFSSPAISDGSVYVGLQGGRVVCLK